MKNNMSSGSYLKFHMSSLDKEKHVFFIR